MKKLAFKLSIAILAIMGLVLLHGCYPSDTLTYEETDVVLTGYYDSVFDDPAIVEELNTYYLPDTVFPISEDDTDVVPEAEQQSILNDIVGNMTAYGWTRVTYAPGVPEPDVMIAVSAIKTTTVSVGWWYPYYPGWGWGWGWGWYKDSQVERGTDYWYGGWGGYYPPGYGWGYVPYYTSYTTGTLLMEMTNPEDYRVMDGDTVNPIYWAGALNGMLNPSSSTTTRVTEGIDQAFSQSPYLKIN